MNHLLRAGFFLACITFLALASCGKSAQSAAPHEERLYEAEPANFRGKPAASEQTGSNSEGPARLLEVENSGQTRKLVKKAELRLRVEDPEATEKPISELIEKYGAWPASAAINENSRNYSIRVPSPSFDALLAELSGLGKTLRRTETAEDVTLSYYDLEGRLATRQELLKTYQGYLGRAKNIDELMTVEGRIADLQQEIDRTGTQLRNLAGLIDYSTITLGITGPPGVSSYTKPGLGEKLGELFSSFGDVASSALVALTGIIIYGTPAVLILILLFWILFGRIGILRKLIRIAAGKK
jgi:hypothetical protein